MAVDLAARLHDVARRAGVKRMDAYAHHPYYGHRSEKPATVSRSKKAVTMGNIGVLIKQINCLWGTKTRLWVTEYGYSDESAGPPLRCLARNQGRST